MEIEIDPMSAVPIYQQIRDRVVEAIAQGELRRGDTLAPVRSLAGAFGISPGTVVKAYDELRREGFVSANGKAGTFVARDPETGSVDAGFVDEWRGRLHTLLAEARAHGMSADDLQQCLDLARSALVPAGASRSAAEAGYSSEEKVR